MLGIGMWRRATIADIKERQIMMNANLQITFYVLDFFSLSDGSTVFTGELADDMSRIPPGEYLLTVDGKTLQEINISSEMMPKKLAPTRVRSINTHDSVKLSKDMLGQNEIKLVKVGKKPIE